jgi:hypothetical protein
MGYSPEIAKRIQMDLDSRLRGEPLEIQGFYKALSEPGQALSVEFLSQIAPEWNKFCPITANGRDVIGYAKPGLDLTPSQSAHLIMPDSPSAGGKTKIVHGLLKMCPDHARIIHTCTTRPLQPDERISETQIISENPRVEARVSPQYLHVSEPDFRRLSEAKFFIENPRHMWETQKPGSGALYGIPRTALEQVGDDSIAYWFLIVDEVGQRSATNWLQANKKDVRLQKWFILPTQQTFSDLENRIMFLRTQQAAPRIIDALHDLWYGAGRTDVILPNPFDASPSHTPHAALSNAKQLMNMLRPGVCQ